MYILFHILFHCGLLQDIEYSSCFPKVLFQKLLSSGVYRDAWL